MPLQVHERLALWRPNQEHGSFGLQVLVNVPRVKPMRLDVATVLDWLKISAT